MSVEPGFSGQAFMDGTPAKVREVVELARAAQNPNLLIQVDGGIGLATAPLVAAEGADVLVCGNAVFKAEDPAHAISAIKACVNEAR
jgi:ribulose-phosphate 3-epimerase